MQFGLIKTILIAVIFAGAPALAYGAEEASPGAQWTENADVSIGLNGLVCDFCSLALNKTFGKNDAVEGSYVDLDTKIMSVVFKSGQTLGHDVIIEMVKDAGYNVTQISYKDGTVFTPPAKPSSKDKG